MAQNLICYCFGYSTEDIRQDYRENNRSTIIARIAAEKKDGNCRCETTNPKGRRCLADIRQVVNAEQGIKELKTV